MTLGIDVSQFDPSVDFAVLKGRNIRFVFVRASQGASKKDNAAALKA